MADDGLPLLKRLQAILRESAPVFGRAFSTVPDVRSNSIHVARQRGDANPLSWLLSQSSVIDAARQVAPRFDFSIGGRQFSVGGYGDEVNAEFDRLRRDQPEVRERTTRIGQYPELEGRELLRGRAAAVSRQAAQVLGLAAKDITTQGIQNIWWFLNAPEAASNLAGRMAIHGSLGKVREPGRLDRPNDAPIGAPMSRHHLRFAATFPLILGASAATGTLFRNPGYAAVLPSEQDKTQTSDPLGEAVMRAVGRTGALLPYDEFVKERPDVSKGEYEAYKAFLFGDKSMIKFTGDGIHGPEVNFVGKSVPLLTGILPIIGGIAGARIGSRMAGNRLAEKGELSRLRAKGVLDPYEEDNIMGTAERLKQAKRLLADAQRHGMGRDRARPESGPRANVEYQLFGPGGPRRLAENEPPWEFSVEDAKALVDEAAQAHAAQLDRVELPVLKGTLLGASAGLGITGAGALLLEQIRRATNMEQNRRAAEEAQQLAPGATVARA